jgi:hypothetical protein
MNRCLPANIPAIPLRAFSHATIVVFAEGTLQLISVLAAGLLNSVRLCACALVDSSGARAKV